MVEIEYVNKACLSDIVKCRYPSHCGNVDPNICSCRRVQWNEALVQTLKTQDLSHVTYWLLIEILFILIVRGLRDMPWIHFALVS
jgi:hypothetical protein